MSEWILILILMNANGGAAIDHVPGFNSERTCRAAAASAIEAHSTAPRANRWPLVASCVERARRTPQED